MTPKLHVETRGSGRPFVLAHGFGGSARNFRPQARAFSDRFRVVCYDARGHARSEAPLESEAYSLQALTDDFARVAEGAGPAPIVAGGLSLGAATALSFALRYPERVCALVLAAYPASGAGSDKTRWALDFADAIAAEGLDAAGAVHAWGTRSRFDPRAAELIRQGFLEHPAHAMEAILRGVIAELPEPDALGETLVSLKVPALVLCGSEDEGSLEPSRELARKLPGARFELVPGAGHVVNLAKPSEFNAAVDAFLAEALTRPGS